MPPLVLLVPTANRRMPPSASEGSGYDHKSLAVPRGAVKNGPKQKQRKIPGKALQKVLEMHEI